MATIQVKAFVTLYCPAWQDKPEIELHVSDMSTVSVDYVIIREQLFDIEVPDNFDPRPLQIEALRKAKSKVYAEAEAKATNIEEQIQRLLCIEAPKDDAEVIL
jgi:hypothetical protein